MASREYHRNYSRDYYHLRKAEYISLLGGKCVKCGATENLQFDHKDCDGKKFPIGKLLNHSREIVEIELRKCQLLCQACHIEKTREDMGGTSKAAKLTMEQAEEARRLAKTMSSQDLASRFGISYSSMRALLRLSGFKR